MKQLAEQKKRFELARSKRSKHGKASDPRRPLQTEKPSQRILGWDRWLPINYRLG